VAGFYAARAGTILALPWPSFALPLSRRWGMRYAWSYQLMSNHMWSGKRMTWQMPRRFVRQ